MKKLCLIIILIFFIVAVGIFMFINYKNHSSVEGALKYTNLCVDFDYKIEDEFTCKESKTKYVDMYKISFDSKYCDSFVENIKNCKAKEDGSAVFTKPDSEILNDILKNEKISKSDFLKTNDFSNSKNTFYSGHVHYHIRNGFSVYDTSKDIIIIFENEPLDSSKTTAYILSSAWWE